MDRQFRLPRRWSNTQLRPWGLLCQGSVVNVSAGTDEDKEGGHYRDYFPNAERYTTTNHAPGSFRGHRGGEEEILLDLESDLPPELKDSFDVVFNHTTLEHVFDLQKAVANLCAMSRDLLIVVVPCAQVQHDHPDFGDYWRILPSGMRKLASQHGFHPLFESVNHHRNASSYLFAVFSRNPSKWQAQASEWQPVQDSSRQLGASNWLNLLKDRLSAWSPRRWITILGALACIAAAWAVSWPTVKFYLLERDAQRVLPQLAHPDEASPRPHPEASLHPWRRGALEAISQTQRLLAQSGVTLHVMILPSQNVRSSERQHLANDLVALPASVTDLTTAFEQLETTSGNSPLAADGWHLSPAGIVLLRAMIDHISSSNTQDPAWILAGDCTAEAVMWCRQTSLWHRWRKSVAPPRALLLYRENGADQMAGALAMLTPGECKSHSQVFWLLHDDAFRADHPAPFPMPHRSSAWSGAKTQDAEVVAASVIDRRSLEQGPYPDALIAIKYRELKNQTEWIGIHPLLQARQWLPSRKIRQGEHLRLKVTDWDDKQHSDPNLARIQLLDDFADPTLPTVWVEEWTKQWMDKPNE
ncbi:MAG: hypothetical protein KDK99_13295 [Verrucomicrobiales bacterium]|nr:hypothetical protein [Verrucomicrobiales bacterium]